MTDPLLAAAEATVTAYRVASQDGGVVLAWGDDPLDFIWQSRAQVEDLIVKLQAAITTPPRDISDLGPDGDGPLPVFGTKL